MDTGYVIHEAYIANTPSWILQKPYLIGKSGNYSFYVGTQISGAGTTVVCSSCHSAIKHYPSNDQKETDQIEKILSSSVCQICSKKIEETAKSVGIKATMNMMATKFKVEASGANL